MSVNRRPRSLRGGQCDDEGTSTRDLVGSLERGLGGDGNPGRASGGPDADRNGGGGRADPRRRAPLPADAGRHRLCDADRAGVSRCRRGCCLSRGPGSAAPRCGPSPSPSCARWRRRSTKSCSAAVLSGEDVVYVARVPGRRILSVSLACRHAAAGLLHLDGARAAVRSCSRTSSKAFLARRKIERRHAEDRSPTAPSSASAIAAGASGRLCHRRRGAGTRPALDRRADPRPRGQDRGGDQCLDPVGAFFRRGDGAGNPAGAADGEAADRGVFLRVSSRLSA